MEDQEKNFNQSESITPIRPSMPTNRDTRKKDNKKDDHHP